MSLHNLVIIVHLFVGLGIVGLVLLQRGKGADAGAGFGAGASGTVFGARGSASFLSRATAVLAAMFFATSLALAYLAGEQTAPTSLMEQGVEMPAPGVDIVPPPADEPQLPTLPAVGIDSGAADAPAAPDEGEAPTE